MLSLAPKTHHYTNKAITHKQPGKMTDIHYAPSSSLIVGGKADGNGDCEPHLEDEMQSTNNYVSSDLCNKNEVSSNAVTTTTATTNSDVKMVKWRGNMVPEKKAKALTHVFDDLQDHFGHNRPDPKVRFNMASTSLNQDNLNTGAWSDNLTFTYLIDGDACNLDYIGMDVCIDLTKKHAKPGSSAFDDYGKSWVYVYVPEATIDKVKAYVKAGTGWDVVNNGFKVDYNRKLTSIEAKMHQAPQPEPSFWVATDNDMYNKYVNPKMTPGVQFTRSGSIQEVVEQPAQQRVHRGVGFFAVSLEVPKSSDVKPKAGFGAEATLSFTLISVRTWGVTDCIAPIVHSPRKAGFDN